MFSLPKRNLKGDITAASKDLKGLQVQDQASQKDQGQGLASSAGS